MESMIINAITLSFVVIIVIYSLISIIANRSLYFFIQEYHKRLSIDHKSSELYNNIKKKYANYIIDNQNANINITSFIEEMCTELTYKNRPILEKIKFIKNASSTTILLGVLGTFVGLSIMLLNVDTQNLINSLPNTISSMQTAFITSICGIVFSIIINMTLDNKNCEYVLTQLMLRLENLLTTEVTHKKSAYFDNKIEEVKNTINKISESIKSIERFDEISRDLKEFNEEFISGIEVLKELLEGSRDSINTFDQDIRKLDKQFSILNMKFSRLFDTYDDQGKVYGEILENIAKNTVNIQNATDTQVKIKEHMRNVSASLGLYERTTQDLLGKLVEHEADMVNINEKVLNDRYVLDNSVDRLSDIITSTYDDLARKLDELITYISMYEDIIEDPIYSEEIYDVEYEYQNNRNKASKSQSTRQQSRQRPMKSNLIQRKKQTYISPNSVVGVDLDDK